MPLPEIARQAGNSVETVTRVYLSVIRDETLVQPSVEDSINEHRNRLKSQKIIELENPMIKAIHNRQKRVS